MAYKQHFIEWFSGKQLPSYWTQNLSIGAPTYAMADEVDGGFKITSNATANSRGTIIFNNKRQYSQTGSICIAVGKRTAGTTNHYQHIGFASSGNPGYNYAMYRDTSNTTYKDLLTNQGSGGATATNTDIVTDTSWHNVKVEMTSTPSAILSIDGVLKVTKTTTLPVIPMQPCFEAGSFITASAGKVSQIRYMECYNT